MDLGNNNGQMVQVMKVNGKMIKVLGGVNYYMWMVIFMKDNGKMIKQMGKGIIYIIMELNIKEM